MTKLRIILIILVLSAILKPQSYGRMDYGQTLSAQNEVQSLESSSESLSLEAAIDPSSYILGAGDELGLNILISENITWLLTITPTGDFLYRR